MSKTNIISRDSEIAEAIARYSKLVLGFENIILNSLDDPYKKKDTYQMALASDILIVDAITREKPKGFRFAKGMEKKVLLLFYPGEIEIEEEGPFWMVLPYGLERLGEKIRELLEKPTPGMEDYEKLEQQYPELGEKKRHHE